MTKQLNLSLAYRDTRREHDRALAEPQNFYLTGDGKAAEWQQFWSKGQSVAQRRVPLAEARYLDWCAQRRAKHD